MPLVSFLVRLRKRLFSKTDPPPSGRRFAAEAPLTAAAVAGRRAVLCRVLRPVTEYSSVRTSVRLVVALGKDDASGGLLAYRGQPKVEEDIGKERLAVNKLRRATPKDCLSEVRDWSKRNGAETPVLASLAAQCFYHGSLAVQDNGDENDDFHDDPEAHAKVVLVSLGAADGNSRIVCTLTVGGVNGCDYGCRCSSVPEGFVIHALLPGDSENE
jgi:hypothetical protein